MVRFPTSDEAVRVRAPSNTLLRDIVRFAAKSAGQSPAEEEIAEVYDAEAGALPGDVA